MKKIDGKKNRIVVGYGLAIVIGIMIVVCIIIIGKDTYVRSKKEDGLSRYEWLAMVCEQFGINESNSNVPYCKDVENDDEYFVYVQSAVEWDLIEKDGSFQGDKPVSGRFAVKTAMKAIGEQALQIYLGTTEEIQDTDYIDLSLEKGIIEKGQLTENLTKTECEALLGRISQFYLVELFEEDVINVEYKEDVIELPEQSIVEEDGNSIKVTTEQMANLKVGDVVVFNSAQTKSTLAKKISSIEQLDTILLEDVAIDEAIETLAVSEQFSVTFDDIADYYGLSGETVIGKHDVSGVTAVSLAKPKEHTYADKGFKVNITTDNNGISISVTDNNTGLEYSLGVDQKNENTGKNTFFDGYSIAAELDVKSINVKAIVKHSGLFVEYIQLLADVDSEISYAIQGEIEKSIHLFSVPLAGTVVSAVVDFNLIVGANGEIKIVAELPLQQGIVYEKNVGIRKLQSTAEYEPPMLEVNCECDFAVQAEPVVKILGCDVIDVELNAGLNASASLASHAEMQCLDISTAFPTVSLEVLGDEERDSLLKDIAEDFNWSLRWNIIDAENAPFQKNFHYETYVDAGSAFVDNCTYQQTGDNAKGNETDNAREADTAAESGLQDYAGYKYALYFIFYSPFEEVENGYVVRGRLSGPDCINVAEFNSLKEGDHFNINGNDYVKGREYLGFQDGIGGIDEDASGRRLDEVQNPHGCCEVYDANGDTYYIADLINPSRTHVGGSEVGNSAAELGYEDNYYVLCNIEGFEKCSLFGEYQAVVAKDAEITLLMPDGESYGAYQTFTADECYQNEIEDGHGNILTKHILNESVSGGGMSGTIKVGEDGLIIYYYDSTNF